MKVAVIYATQHGTTEKVAGMLRDYASCTVDLINLKKQADVNLSDYSKIIIGGSIHAGMIQKRVTKFCEKHMKELTSKPLGLYLSCMDEQKAQMQFETAYNDMLRKHATARKLTGGEVIIERMNFIEKFLMKKIGKITSSTSNIKEDKVKELAQEMGLC